MIQTPEEVKQEIYEQATRELLSDTKGTRMDIVFRAMDIYARQFADAAFEAGARYTYLSDSVVDEAPNKQQFLDNLFK